VYDTYVFIICFLIFEPIGDHSAAGVDVDLPSPPGTGVDELVWRAGRDNHDLAAGGLDGVLSHREGQLALLHHEDLIVGVLVQIRSLTGGRVGKEERDIHVAVLVDLERVHAPVVGKLIVADYLGHVSSSVLMTPGSESRSRRLLGER
jgi:hypothetical protein